MERSAFLERVREAARQGQAYRISSQPLPPQTGYVGVAGDLCERFVAEANLVGGEAELVANHEAARQALAGLLRRYQVKTALLWQHEVLDRCEIPALLAQEGIVQHDYRSLAPAEQDQQRRTVLAADIGITSVATAIAETGTLAMFSRPGRERMTSLVPPVHVAIIEARQMVPDLFDLFATLRAEELPANITLITGPSKTGDIELQLTTGVHGPGHWHLLVIRGAAS